MILNCQPRGLAMNVLSCGMTRVQKILIFLLIGSALLTNLLIMFPYGWNHCFQTICGISFSGMYRAHDEIWHMALAQTAFRSFPFQTPIFAGAPLTGYHYLSSLLIVPFSLLWIPPAFTFFWILPIIWFALFTWISWKIARAITPSFSFLFFYLFFQFFAGSLNYLIRLRNYGDLFIQKSELTLQSAQYLRNPPAMWSFITFLIVLYFLIQKKRTKASLILITLCVILGYGFKFYGGISISLLIFFYSIFSPKKNSRLLLVMIITSAASVLFFYNPFISVQTGGIFSFAPFATVHQIIEDKDYFYLPNLVLARYYLTEHGLSPRLIGIETLSVIMMIFFSFGTRIIAIFSIAYHIILKKMSSWQWSILLTSITLLAFSFLLIQKGDWFNTIQFSFYAMLAMNIFAAWSLYYLIRIPRFKIVGYYGAILIVLLTIHTSIDTVYAHFLKPKLVYISTEEVRALSFLNKEPYGTVFSLPFIQGNMYDPTNTKPLILYNTVDTAYIAAYTAKPLWYADQGQLAVTGVNYKNRKQQFATFSKFALRETGARYFYIIKAHPLAKQAIEKAKKEKLNLLYDNEFVRIYN